MDARKLKVKRVSSVGRGHYWGMNPLAAEALRMKNPRGTIPIAKDAPARTVAHEKHEYSILKRIKQAKKGKKLSRADYKKAHRQTIDDGFP